MDAMHAALRAKRAGMKTGGLLHEQAETPDMEMKEEQGVDLKSLVASLSDEQKSELMEMLSGDEAETPATEIEKGAASSEEKKGLRAKVAKDEAMAAEDNEPTEETDEAMVNGDRVVMAKMNKGVPPKGLGERAKMAAVERLKAKGKV